MAPLVSLLKGTPQLYYGQELGMPGAQRPEYKSDEKDIGTREAFEWNATVESAGHATWYKGQKSYWTQRYSRDNDGISVAEQDRDPASLLNHYRRLFPLRSAHPALRSGTQHIVPTGGNILVVERVSGGEKIRIIANLSGESAEYPVSGRDLLSGSAVDAVQLKPFETAVIRL